MDILKVSGAVKDYGRFRLDNVSLALPQGCIMGLIGENGAGKSTLIKWMLGLVKRDAGEIFYNGKPLDVNDKAQMEQIGVVFDALHFPETFTATQIGKLHEGLYRNWDSACYSRYLERFSLPEKEAVKGFSKGMQMKLGIACALSHGAKLLILDEPTAGLDPIARDDLMEVFLDFVQDETNCILLSTHITADLEKIADYVTFLHEGKVQFTHPKDMLRMNFASCAAERLLFRNSGRKTAQSGGKWTFSMKSCCRTGYICRKNTRTAPLTVRPSTRSCCFT